MTRLKALCGAALSLCLIAPSAALAGSKSGVDGTLDVSVVGTIPTTLAGATSNATDAQATTATNLPTASYNYGFNGATWDRLQVDGSKNLKINCLVGCNPVGSTSNGADAQATTTNNQASADWLFGFNGTTWDRLQVDASKSLKDTPQATTTGGSTALCTGQIKAVATACGSAAAHQVYTYVLDNSGNTALTFFQIFDVAVGSVTLGTTVAAREIAVAPGGQMVIPQPVGDAFANQITIACTTTATGLTAPTNNCSFTVFGK